MNSKFVYVTYIRTTPARLWEALTDPEFNRQFCSGTYQETLWKPGAEWKLKLADGRVADAGEVVEFEPPRRLVLKWRNELRPELTAEGYSRCVMELEPEGELVKLTVTHSLEKEGSQLINAVSTGWPKILSSLKTLLESGALVSEIPALKSA